MNIRLAKIFLLPFFIIGSYSLLAQTEITILDKQTSQPVKDVIVLGEGFQQLTKNDGKLVIPENVRYVIVSRLGYEPQELSISNEKTVVVNLLPNLLYEELKVSAYPIENTEFETPASFTRLNSREIEFANAVDYGQVINNAPGVFMHSGTLGTSRITIRGIGARTPFGTNKIKAYYGEIPLTAGNGESSIEDNELLFLENIDIIKGPASSAYGAGLAGVIKLNPLSSGNSSVSLLQGMGAFGLNRTVIKGQINSNQHHAIVGYSNLQSDGYRENSEYDRNYMFANWLMQSDQMEINVLATYTDVLGFIPSSINEDQFLNNPESAASNWLGVNGYEDYQKAVFGATITNTLSKSIDLSNTVFLTERENYELRPFGILTENSNIIGFRSKLNGTFQKLEFSIGGEYLLETYETTTIDQIDRLPGALNGFNRQKRQVANVFGDSKFIISEKFDVEAGINFNTTQYNLDDLFAPDSIDQSGRYKFDPIWSPRVAINFTPNSNLKVYGLLSHGYSAPSVVETLTPDGLINTEIQPERGLNIELGTKGIIDQANLKYSLALYLMEVKDLLVAERVGQDQFVGVNAGKTTHDGIEIQIQQQSDIGVVQFTPFATYSLSQIKFKDFQNLEDDFSGNRLPGVPNSLLNVGANFSIPIGLFLNIQFRHVGSMYLKDDNLLESDPYSLVNAKVGLNRTFQKLGVSIDFGVNNLLDERYASMVLVNATGFGGADPRFYYPGLPLHAFGNIKLTYTFLKD